LKIPRTSRAVGSFSRSKTRINRHYPTSRLSDHAIERSFPVSPISFYILDVLIVVTVANVSKNFYVSFDQDFKTIYRDIDLIKIIST